jgi:hypothetical protein
VKNLYIFVLSKNRVQQNGLGLAKAKKSGPGKEFSKKDRKHKKLTLGLEKKDISQYKAGNMP